MNEPRYREHEARLWTSVGLAPTERRLRMDRTGGTVRIQELGEGPVVLFIHGANNGGTSWADLVAGLPGFHCVLLDRPGCGLSDGSGDVFADPSHLGSFAEGVVLDVMDALGLDSARLVATSYGGFFALRTAANHPDRVTHLVEFGWTLGAPMAPMPPIMRAAGAPGLRQILSCVPPSRGAVRAMFRQIGLREALANGRVSDEVVDWYRALLRDTRTVANELRSTSRLLSFRRGVDEALLFTDELLARIESPTLFVWGEEDPFGGTAVAQDLAARVPGAALELLAGAGHAVWIDDPDRTADLVQSFLSRPPTEADRATAVTPGP